MSKTLIAKPTLIAASALLLASLAGVHNVKAEQSMPGFDAVDAHEQARRLLQRPAITASNLVAPQVAVRIAHPILLDAHTQARQLLLRPITGVGEGTGFEDAALILEPERADAHTQAEHLLLRSPFGY